MAETDVLSVSDVDELIDRGLDAVEAEDFDAAERIVDEAGGLAGENHVRVLHLQGMLAWAQGDLDHATGYLQQAVDLKPTRLEIYLDCAECLFLCDERSEAEANVRAGLALDDLNELQEGEARLLLAQLRLADDDPDESLEVLDAVTDELKAHPAYLSTFGAALIGADRGDEAVAALRRAAEAEPEDPEYTYQLAVALEASGAQQEAIAQMLRVLELDTQLAGGAEAPSAADVETLKGVLDDVLEELPDPLLKLVGTAPVEVQARATAEQVKAGIDPRAAVFFEGTRKSPQADAALAKIILAKDVILDEVEDDDEIPTMLLFGIAEQIQEFFDREVVLAEA
jgi:tetratricopeptide (TPR) repeat protein